MTRRPKSAAGAGDGGEGKDRTPFLGSAVIHVGAFALAFWVSVASPPPLLPEAIQVELHSPPGAAPSRDEAAAREDRLVVERPNPTSAPEPSPAPEARTEAEEAPRTAPEPEEAPPPVRSADLSGSSDDPSEVEQAGEDLEVRMEGLKTEFPLYYENIVRQLDHCFRGDRSRPRQARVRFVIGRDGSVDDATVEVVGASGDVIFDLRAIEAVECAGKGRFGPLPEELRYDRLPVLFNLSIRGRVDA